MARGARKGFARHRSVANNSPLLMLPVGTYATKPDVASRKSVRCASSGTSIMRTPIGSLAPLASTSCTLCGPGCVTGTVSVSMMRVLLPRGYGVKVIRCELRVVFVERFRNLDHVGQASVDSGSVALVAFHVRELL